MQLPKKNAGGLPYSILNGGTMSGPNAGRYTAWQNIARADRFLQTCSV
jgi:hypothetical protein